MQKIAYGISAAVIVFMFALMAFNAARFDWSRWHTNNYWIYSEEYCYFERANPTRIPALLIFGPKPVLGDCTSGPPDKHIP